jgi:aspartyl/glutamyl-tRNA(Asn/Gln) amidotransferase C subunit
MITTEEVKSLEKLCRIELDDNSRAKYAKEMSSIMSYIEEIKDMQINSTQLAHSSYNRLRDDVCVIAKDHKHKALDNAPDKLGDYYKVTQVIK